MSRKAKMAVLLTVDSGIILLSNLVSYIFLNSMMPMSKRYMVYSLIIQWALYILFGFLLNVFSRITRYNSIDSIISIFLLLVLF